MSFKINPERNHGLGIHFRVLPQISGANCGVNLPPKLATLGLLSLGHL